MTLIPNNHSIIGEKNCLTSLIAACPTAQRQAQNCLGFFHFFPHPQCYITAPCRQQSISCCDKLLILFSSENPNKSNCSFLKYTAGAVLCKGYKL